MMATEALKNRVKIEKADFVFFVCKNKIGNLSVESDLFAEKIATAFVDTRKNLLVFHDDAKLLKDVNGKNTLSGLKLSKAETEILEKMAEESENERYESDARKKQLEINRNYDGAVKKNETTIFVGCDTGVKRESNVCEKRHNGKFDIGGEWTTRCKVCELSLMRLSEDGKIKGIDGEKIRTDFFISEIEKVEKEMEEKKNEKQRAVAEIFKKAKETNEKQVLSSYSVECNFSDNEECSVDNIIVYAMPDGSSEEIRSHTY